MKKDRDSFTICEKQYTLLKRNYIDCYEYSFFFTLLPSYEEQTYTYAKYLYFIIIGINR